LDNSSPLLPIVAPRFCAAQIGLHLTLCLVLDARRAADPCPKRTRNVMGGVGAVGFFALTVVSAIIGDVRTSMALNVMPDQVLGSGARRRETHERAYRPV